MSIRHWDRCFGTRCEAVKSNIEKIPAVEQLLDNGVIGHVSRSKRVRGGGARRGATIECSLGISSLSSDF